VFYSDDHGDTWHLGPNVVADGNECRLVELANGDVMLNARDADNRRRPDRVRRWVSISHDGGDSWDEPYADAALACPQCHASLKRYGTEAEHGKNRILFSNPNSRYRSERHPYGRFNLSVKISEDEGRSWTAGRTVYPFVSSYSDLVVLPDMTIGLLYERGPQGSVRYWDEIQFARFDLRWLTGGE
jgi:sialidase-1